MIINNQSGLRNSKVGLLDAMDVFCAHGYDVTTYITQRKNDAYEYIKKNKVKYEIICVFGGDGTLNEVSNGLMNKKYKPKIGYFPSGTMNDFGSNFNLGNDFKKIAQRICEGKDNSFDVGNCNGKYFNYVAAFGALCDVPYTTSRKAKQSFGTLAYIAEGLSKLDTIKPINAKITVNGKTKKMKLLFGLVFSGGRVAGNQLVSKTKSKMNDGEFNVLLVEYVDTPILDMPDLWAVLTKQNKYLHKYKSSQISFEFEDKVNWTLDGEEAKLGNVVTINNIKEALTIKA